MWHHWHFLWWRCLISNSSTQKDSNAEKAFMAFHHHGISSELLYPLWGESTWQADSPHRGYSNTARASMAFSHHASPRLAASPLRGYSNTDRASMIFSHHGNLIAAVYCSSCIALLGCVTLSRWGRMIHGNCLWWWDDFSWGSAQNKQHCLCV